MDVLVYRPGGGPGAGVPLQGVVLTCLASECAAAHRRTGADGAQGGSASPVGEEPGACGEVLGVWARALTPGVQLLVGYGDRRGRRRPASWDHGDGAAWRRDGRLMSLGVDRARTLA